MRVLILLLVGVSIGCSACHINPSGRSIDREKALRVSNQFINTLQTGKFDDALSLMEPDFVRTLDRTRAEVFAHKVLDSCGSAGQLTLSRDEVGNEFYPDGKINPMRKFIYAIPTTAASSKGCMIYVEIVQESNHIMVDKFGSTAE